MSFSKISNMLRGLAPPPIRELTRPRRAYHVTVHDKSAWGATFGVIKHNNERAYPQQSDRKDTDTHAAQVGADWASHIKPGTLCVISTHTQTDESHESNKTNLGKGFNLYRTNKRIFPKTKAQIPYKRGHVFIAYVPEDDSKKEIISHYPHQKHFDGTLKSALAYQAKIVCDELPYETHFVTIDTACIKNFSEILARLTAASDGIFDPKLWFPGGTTCATVTEHVLTGKEITLQSKQVPNEVLQMFAYHVHIDPSIARLIGSFQEKLGTMCESRSGIYGMKELHQDIAAEFNAVHGLVKKQLGIDNDIKASEYITSLMDRIVQDERYDPIVERLEDDEMLGGYELIGLIKDVGDELINEALANKERETEADRIGPEFRF